MVLLFSRIPSVPVAFHVDCLRVVSVAAFAVPAAPGAAVWSFVHE
jgi:hypothetical protein